MLSFMVTPATNHKCDTATCFHINKINIETPSMLSINNMNLYYINHTIIHIISLLSTKVNHLVWSDVLVSLTIEFGNYINHHLCLSQGDSYSTSTDIS